MGSLKLFHQGPKEWGNILVTMLVAISITTIVAVMINRMVMGKENMEKRARDTLDADGLKTYILEKIDCRKTMPVDFATSCEQKTYLDIIGKDGKPIVVSAGELGSPLGNVAMRASCHNKKRKLTIETRSLPFQGAPFTGEEIVWKDLFAGAKICGLLYPEQEDSSYEQHHNMVYLDFYPSGNFRANGGDLEVTVEKIFSDTSCHHRLVGGESEVSDKGTFQVEQRGLLHLKAGLKGCRGQNQNVTLDLTDPRVTMIKQGKNIWRIVIEESMKVGALRGGRSIWQLTAEPKAH